MIDVMGGVGVGVVGGGGWHKGWSKMVKDEGRKGWTGFIKDTQAELKGV